MVGNDRNGADAVSSGHSGESTGDSDSGRWSRFKDWIEDLIVPWGKMLLVLLDPPTVILGIVAVILGLFGPRAVAENYNAVLQVVIAVVTGLVGARVSTALSALNQESKLHASGKMAVRGLRLILTKTLALERRVSTFVEENSLGSSAETSAAVAQRNLDEVLESVRTLQLEIAGSIDNWVDVVPGADVASVLVAVAELRDRVTLKDAQLREAVQSKAALENKGTADERLLSLAEERIAELEREKDGLVKDIGALKKSVTLPADAGGIAHPAPLRGRLVARSLGKPTSGNAVTSLTASITSLQSLSDAEAGFGTESHKLPK